MKYQKRLSRVLMAVLVAGLVAGMATMVQAFDFEVGIGPGVAPDYEGSDDYQFVPFPYGLGEFDNGMWVRLAGSKLSANLMPKGWVEWLKVGPVYNYRLARSDVDNNRVDALKNVSDANELGAFVGVEWNNWFANLEFLTDTGDAHDGSLTTLGGGYNWVISDAWALRIGVSGTYASDDYMSTYFGIDLQNSLRSGLPVYDADGGIKDVGFDLGLSWGFANSWSLRGMADYKRLVGDADNDSPVTDEGSENQFFGAVLIIYHFGGR